MMVIHIVRTVTSGFGYASYLQLCIRRFEEALIPQVLFRPEGNASISQHLVQLLLILDACKVA